MTGLMHIYCLCLLTTASGGVEFEFASAKAGREILQADDDFMQRLSPFDLQARLQTTEKVAPDQYKKLLAANVLEWEDAQIESIRTVMQDLEEPLAKLKIPNMPTLQFVATTGREESGAAYTRANAIFLTKAQLQMNKQGLKKLVLHELFHVISRANLPLRDRLYNILGFVPSNEIILPQSLRDRGITNPDAPIIQHVLKVKLDSQEEALVAPVLYAKTDYDPNVARSMFGYLNFGLMKVTTGANGQLIATEVDGEPVLFDKSLADFRRQIGRNTEYIIHPEEVLADNFVELMMENSNVPDPWILKRMGNLILHEESN